MTGVMGWNTLARDVHGIILHYLYHRDALLEMIPELYDRHDINL